MMMNIKTAVCILGFATIAFIPEMSKIQIGSGMEATEAPAADTSARPAKDSYAAAAKPAREKETLTIALSPQAKKTAEHLGTAMRYCIEQAVYETAAAEAPAADCTAPAADYPAEACEAPAADCVAVPATEPVADDSTDDNYTIDESDGSSDTVTIVRVLQSVPLKAEPECNARKITSLSRNETYKYVTTHVCGDMKWYEVDFWGECAYINADACEIMNLSEEAYEAECEYMRDLYGAY